MQRYHKKSILYRHNEDPMLGSLRGYVIFSRKEIEKRINLHKKDMNMDNEDIQTG